MKTKRYSGHYSLEERMVEPFRAIRWISVSNSVRFMGIFGLISFTTAWWIFRNEVFQFWGNFLKYLVTASRESWVVGYGHWPENYASLMEIPKLTAGILPPFVGTWWFFLAGTIATWVITDVIRSSLLPLKAMLRFIVFLVWISLGCFAYSPLSFKHSVEEWSKIYFLGAYGSILVYSIIWTFGVLWLPISNRIKVFTTLLVLAFEMIAIPLTLFISTVVLSYSSLLLLPLFALLIAPLIQLGWFVCFYSFTLSFGSDPSKEVRLE